jgi:hypothetical protein
VDCESLVLRLCFFVWVVCLCFYSVNDDLDKLAVRRWMQNVAKLYVLYERTKCPAFEDFLKKLSGAVLFIWEEIAVCKQSCMHMRPTLYIHRGLLFRDHDVLYYN